MGHKPIIPSSRGWFIIHQATVSTPGSPWPRCRHGNPVLWCCWEGRRRPYSDQAETQLRRGLPHHMPGQIPGCELGDVKTAVTSTHPNGEGAREREAFYSLEKRSWTSFFIPGVSHLNTRNSQVGSVTICFPLCFGVLSQPGPGGGAKGPCGRGQDGAPVVPRTLAVGLGTPLRSHRLDCPLLFLLAEGRVQRQWFCPITLTVLVLSPQQRLVTGTELSFI